MRFRNIIFDFDGTLVDSQPGIVKSFKSALSELTPKKVNDREVIKLIGKPLAQIISILLETEDKNLIDKGSKLFKKYYNENGLYENTIYPGIKEMLKSLKEQSCKLFVVSNKIESFMDKILAQRDIKKYFVSVLGTDGFDLKSKKADYVKSILVNHQLKKTKTCMIGDTENDIMAGKANFIYCVGASWGYGRKEDLIKAKADKIINRPLELVKLIKK